MSITAMRQALKALEDLQHDLTKPLDGYHEQSGHAITALRAAIEQAEKRQWVGLTDEEAMQAWEGIIKYAPGGVRLKDFARAIEAKLKEKNHER